MYKVAKSLSENLISKKSYGLTSCKNVHFKCHQFYAWNKVSEISHKICIGRSFHTSDQQLAPFPRDTEQLILAPEIWSTYLQCPICKTRKIKQNCAQTMRAPDLPLAP